MSSRGKPELLAPAGGWKQLKAAVRFGADAVYLACDRFGMRAKSENFPLDELPRAVAFAHGEGVRVHVAMNTLMDGEDLKMLPEYLEAVEDAGADALIISDLGAFSLAGRYAPHVQRHVSTQASVMNAETARMWHSLGASRVICAREMTLAGIVEMRAAAPDDLEIETFVHGSMCMAYSGRCLLSSVMTGRSGNKGNCAQSCRWSYALVEERRPGEYFPIEEDIEGSYVMNAEDLNMIEHIGELVEAGVDSFKIEGRNKLAFYVATVTGAYRSVIDGGSVEAAQRELHSISHRPYGTGFFFGLAAQTPDREGYVRACIHVATVEDCEPAGEGKWLITAQCHNSFDCMTTLEALRAREMSCPLSIFDIRWLAPADGGLPFVERGEMALEEVRAQSVPTRVESANRSKEHYIFLSDVPLKPGDFIRKRQE